jgi:GT2 family glycosyltransferase
LEKSIRKYIPEFIKQVYRFTRARFLSIGLARSGRFAQPEEEIEASRCFSVIVAIHDAPQVTSRCLASLQEYGAFVEIILVDDGSMLNETQKLITDYQQRNGWKVIRNDKPVRHSRACEKGSKYASRPYLCFLNSDTVVSPYSWAGIKDAFEANAEVAVVGPATSTNTHQLASRRAFYCNHHWTNEQIYSFAQRYTSKQPNHSRIEVQTVNGFAFFIRNSVWTKCGGFLPDLPDYGNDTELCARLCRQGYKIILTKNSYIHHFGAGSIGKTMSRSEMNKRQLSAQRYIDKVYSQNRS